MKKRFVLGLMLLCGATAIEAQDEVETTIGADVVSSYIWRGQDLGSAALQPTLGVGYKGLSLTAWGSYGLPTPDRHEGIRPDTGLHHRCHRLLVQLRS